MRNTTKRRLCGTFLALVISAVPVTSSAEDPSAMPGGYGMGCDVLGTGMGMPGGYGAGGGMMGGMMGPGMMGGYGMGMPFAGPLAMLDLSDEQRSKIEQVQSTLRNLHRSVILKMFDAQDALRAAYAKESPDPKAVGAAYAAIADLHRQMLEAHIQAQNDVQTLLTTEQREQLRQWRHGRPFGRGMMGR